MSDTNRVECPACKAHESGECDAHFDAGKALARYADVDGADGTRAGVSYTPPMVRQ